MSEIFAVINGIRAAIGLIEDFIDLYNKYFGDHPYELKIAIVFKNGSFYGGMSKDDTKRYLNSLITRPFADDFRIKSVEEVKHSVLPPAFEWFDKQESPITVIYCTAGNPAIKPAILGCKIPPGEPILDGDYSCLYEDPKDLWPATFYVLRPNYVVNGLLEIMGNHPEPKMLFFAMDFQLTHDNIIKYLIESDYLKEKSTGTEGGGSTGTGISSAIGIGIAVLLAILLLGGMK